MHPDTSGQAARDADDRSRITDAVRAGSRAVASLLLLAAATGGLIVAAQLASFLSFAATLPAWGRGACYAAGAALAFATAWAFAELLRRYLRLRRSPRVSLAAIDELRARKASRARASAATAAARDLRTFLAEYPDDGGQRRFLEDAGRSDGAAVATDRLYGQRRRLLADESGVDRQWIADLDANFLQSLDAVADRRITRYRTVVAVKTALAPTGLMDTLIVLLNSWLLTSDLCRIYNVRADLAGTTWVLLNSVVSAAVASRLEDAADDAGGFLAELKAEVPSVFEGVAAGIGDAGLRHLGPRVAEGAANAMLLWRLGRIVRHQLRPVTR